MAEKQLSNRAQRHLRLEVARRLVTSTSDVQNAPRICRKRLRTESESETEISKTTDSELGSVGTLNVELAGSEGSGLLVVKIPAQSSASERGSGGGSEILSEGSVLSDNSDMHSSPSDDDDEERWLNVEEDSWETLSEGSRPERL